MTITVATNSHRWTNFETTEWAKADLEHYGEEIDWDKKAFKITATDKSKTIGNLRMDVRVGVAYIDAVIVAEGHRGQGIGQQLLAKAEQVARDSGAHKIYLQTGKDWESAKFYQRLGYTITSELPNHYFHVDFIELTKFLN